MASLWTENEHGGHPWIAGRPQAPDAQPTAAATTGRAHDKRARFGRPAVMAATCAAAALAGALIEVLR